MQQAVCLVCFLALLGGTRSALALQETAAPAMQPTLVAHRPEFPPVSDLRPWFVAEGIGPRRQGRRPTCSVFTVTSAIEAAITRIGGRGQRLSVDYLNWAGNAATHRNDDGDFFHNILAGWESSGAIPESAWPYARSFDGAYVPDDALVATGRENLERWSSRVKVHWIKTLGPPGLDELQFAEFRRRLTAGDAVAIGSSHSRLAVGYIEDAAAPSGGRVLTLDSGSGTFSEVGADFIRQHVNDAFWVEAVRTGDPGASVDLRPLLLGRGLLPDAEPAAGMQPWRAIATLVVFECGFVDDREPRRLTRLESDATGDPAIAGTARLARISTAIAAGHPVIAHLHSGDVRVLVGQQIDASDAEANAFILVDPTVGGYARLPFVVASREIDEAVAYVVATPTAPN